MIQVHNRYGNGAYYTVNDNPEEHPLPSCMQAREQRIKTVKLEDAKEEQQELLGWVIDNMPTHPDWEKKIQRLSEVEIIIQRLVFVRSPLNTGIPETINIIQ